MAWILISLLTLAFNVKLALAGTANVRSLFAEGQQVFSKGEYEKAAKVFGKTLEKFPDHEPSLLYLGKSLFRLKRYDEAWIAFQNIKEQNLNSESKYEFGYTAYRKKIWDRASETLKTIPESDANYDIAMYYTGVALINLNQLREASTYLKKAIILPPRFAGSRRNLLAYIKGELAHQELVAKQTSESNSQPPSKSRPFTFKPETLEDQEEEQPQESATGSFNPKRSFGIFYDQSNIRHEMSGVSKASGKRMSAGAYVQGSVASSESDAGYFVGLEAKGGKSIKSGNAIPIGISDFETIDVWEKLLPWYRDNGQVSEILVNFKPGLQFIAPSWTGQVYAAFKMNNSGDYSNQSTGAGGIANISLGQHDLELGAEGARWHGDNYSNLTAYSAYAQSLFKISDRFLLDIGAARHLLQNDDDRLETPVGFNQIKARAELSFGLGFKLSGSGSLMNLENHLKLNNQGGSTTADGSRIGFGAGFEWSPLKWLSLEIKQNINKYTWRNVSPVQNELTWDGSVANFEDISSIYVKFYRSL